MSLPASRMGLIKRRSDPEASIAMPKSTGLASGSTLSTVCATLSSTKRTSSLLIVLRLLSFPSVTIRLTCTVGPADFAAGGFGSCARVVALSAREVNASARIAVFMIMLSRLVDDLAVNHGHHAARLEYLRCGNGHDVGGEDC